MVSSVQKDHNTLPSTDIDIWTSALPESISSKFMQFPTWMVFGKYAILDFLDIYIAQICSSHSRLQLFALFDYLYMRTPVKLNQKGRKCLHAKLVPNNYDLCMCMILTSKVN